MAHALKFQLSGDRSRWISELEDSEFQTSPRLHGEILCQRKEGKKERKLVKARVADYRLSLKFI